MLVGVISDTHGDRHATGRAIRMFESFEVGLVVHCGDIGTGEVVELFSPWPTHFVLGNMDYAGPLETAIDQANQICHGRYGTLELEGRRIVLLHGDDARRLRETIASGQWDLVCRGHTHEASILRHDSTLILNPGAVARSEHPSVAVVELPSLSVTPVPL